MPIAFLTLICGIILNQYLGILNNSYTISMRESPLSQQYKVFIGTHVLDIVTIFEKDIANLASKERTIVELQETFDDLNEIIKRRTKRKIILETLIRALKKYKGVSDEDKDNQEVEEENDDSNETDE